MDMPSARIRLAAAPSSEGVDQAEVSPTVKENTEEYRRRLAANLLDGSDPSAKVLSFKHKAPNPPPAHASESALTLNGLYSAHTSSTSKDRKRSYRSVPQQPERILDAPELVDDYYLNLLDWGSQDLLAVALGTSVYLWNASSGSISELMEADPSGCDPNAYISSLKWAADGRHIAVGISTGETQVWDGERLRRLRTMDGHSGRVCSLSWSGGILSSGSRDSTVVNHDVRLREHAQNTLTGHSQEVCGLAWSPSGNQLATGGNDNMLYVYDARALSRNEPTHCLTGHNAAVKALAWCPFQSNLLASGGGTADRTIRFWNTFTGCELNCVDTKSQVCALQWNSHEREILSSHGYSQNQLCLWRYPSMTKTAELTGHTQRALHMSQSPDGRTVASAAADETLRFWQVFGDTSGASGAKATSGSVAARSKNGKATAQQRTALTRNIR
jgi:cell division cycle protein 20 (cofactor of APC complex)